MLKLQPAELKEPRRSAMLPEQPHTSLIRRTSLELVSKEDTDAALCERPADVRSESAVSGSPTDTVLDEMRADDRLPPELRSEVARRDEAPRNGAAVAASVCNEFADENEGNEGIEGTSDGCACGTLCIEPPGAVSLAACGRPR